MALPAVLRDIGVRKTLLYIIGLIPLVALFVRVVFSPSADPYEHIAHVTGENALRLLMLTLAVSPLIWLLNKPRLCAYRRTLGVLTFTYVVVHFAAYVVFEAEFDLGFLLKDIPERNFIAVGVIAFVLMLPLGLTSTNYAVCKLGKKWKKLHRLMYPIALLAPLHFLMLQRGENLTEPLIYMAIAIALLAFRVVKWRTAKRARAVNQPA